MKVIEQMKLTDRMDATLIHTMLGAMTVGMKGEVFASLVLSDLDCQVVNANATTVNSKHVDLLVTRNNVTVKVQVKTTAYGSRGSFIGVNDALVADGEVEWFCVPVIDNQASELLSLVFVRTDVLTDAGKRFPSNDHRCEVLHSKVATLPTLTAPEWVSRVFDNACGSTGPAAVTTTELKH